MRRRSVLRLMAGAAGWPLAAWGQQPARPARFGWLSGARRDQRPIQQAVQAFRQALSELGYTEERNLAIEYRFAEGDLNRLPQLAADLVQLNVDLIVAVPSPAAVAARKATDKIPIVMVNVGDPVGLGLVESLARPGGNVTGLAYSVGLETFAKGVEFLKEVIPDLRSVAILSNPNNAAHALAIESIVAAASAFGVQAQAVEARSADDFEGAFAAMAERRVGAVMIVPDVLMRAHVARLSDLALRHRLPSVRGFKDEVEMGGLLSYGPNFLEPWGRTATIVDKLLKGANPAELPVQQPTRFELVVNMRTARALGLDIPPSLLAQADEVIE